ncbi:MAG: hypothetical protein B6I35_02775 [Anaerolineaceae bacterium 4572_32.2]|nr:MAG: hypothetical protein B6I35_02775 [Anaerolineaceae bacterium 4572_32.2]
MKNRTTTFCPRCGTETEEAKIAGRVRQACPACGFVLYRNPVPGAGVLVEMETGIVLVQRGQPPFVGWWALPAGYIEADESVEQAAVRECQEETGLEVELLELFGVYSFPEGPVQPGLIIFYRARPVGGENWPFVPTARYWRAGRAAARPNLTPARPTSSSERRAPQMKREYWNCCP